MSSKQKVPPVRKVFKIYIRILINLKNNKILKKKGMKGRYINPS